MKIFFSLVLLFTASMSNGADVVKKAGDAIGSGLDSLGKATIGLGNDIDRKLIHGNFPGVTVKWNCTQGKNGVDGYLPSEKDVKITLNRAGDIGFKPNIFQTNLNVGSFLKNLFDPQKVDRSVDYDACREDFMANVKTALTDYQSSSCDKDDPKGNPVCSKSIDQLLLKVEGKLSKSPYLKKKDDEKEKLPVESVTPIQSTPSEVLTQAPEIQSPINTDEEEVPTVSAPQNEKYFALLGGGGESPGPNTIFDPYIKSIKDFNQNGNWNTKIVFNGGHQETEDIIANELKSSEPRENFVPSNFEKTIKSYEDKIASGEIKPGDQIFININTHGSPATSEIKTHIVAAAFGYSLNREGTHFSDGISLDRLKSLVALAEAKGVKLAIADMSCFSGLSQSLASDKTCVISGTGPDHFSYGGTNDVFSSKFALDLKKGKNLEEVFLQARKESSDPGFPMISTAAGDSVHSKIYPFISRYINFRYAGRGYFSTDIQNDLESNACESAPDQFATLMNLTDQVGNAMGKSYSDFKKALEEYYNYRMGIFQQLKDYGAEKIEKKYDFCFPKGVLVTTSGCMTYKAKELLSFDFDRMMTQVSSDSGEYILFQAAKKKRDEIVSQYPNLDKVKGVYESIDKDNKTYDLAAKVSMEARKLYDDLYQLESQNTSKPNPCRDFKL